MENSRIRIAELLEKDRIEDENLIIVEDDEDTKRSTISKLKKSLCGDAYDPTSNLFYSSKKISDLQFSLKREINTKASAEKILELESRIANIIAGNGEGKDSEIIDARNGKESLSKRLSYDLSLIESAYMKKIERIATGKVVNISGHYGYVDIAIVESTIRDTSRLNNGLTVHSKNLYDNSNTVETAQIVKNQDNGVDYTQTESGSVMIELPLPFIYKSGKYQFMAGINLSNDFRDVEIKFNITYSDGTIESIPYRHEECIKFEAKKGFNKITLLYNAENIVDGASVAFTNIMLISGHDDIDKFIPYEWYSYRMNIGENKFKYYNNDYIYESNIPNGLVSIKYHDNEIDTEWLYDEMMKLKFDFEDKREKCGLIEEYGTYQFLDNIYTNIYEDGITIEDSEDEYIRNGVRSKKITIAKNATRNSMMRLPMDNHISVINNIGLFFYADRPDFSLFDATTGGIKIRLCSDSISNNTEINYYEYIITKKEMVQGWNFVKKRIVDFKSVGDPDPNNIEFICVEISRTDEMNGLSVYLNSFVFNQRMKPSVLLCFNGLYDESITYLYPYLKTRDIKASVFLNARKTLTTEAIDTLLKYKIKHGWDIGLDGCHPNKELLTQDDNYRNQYTLLRNSMGWLADSITHNPVSYSAPYGNLRPITVPLIKDLGFKIAKTDADGYCGFFCEKDLAVPMHLISNNVEIEEIIDKIDYAIETGQSIVLYTNDVTEYGSEIDSKKIMFESVVNYIYDKIEEGSIECMTFKEFYNKCVN